MRLYSWAQVKHGVLQVDMREEWPGCLYHGQIVEICDTTRPGIVCAAGQDEWKRAGRTTILECDPRMLTPLTRFAVELLEALSS